ncbi:chemotaxis protein [Paenibacillus psychroresistens]|uniref:Chemotaxis protein n=1 Tax=Paenibacillus psychroresistens TaxID=1778678 RepID=A0A6B8RDM0_9BACL|nr:chemotaxis protein [Paenibacillus psychroresistens]QGQ94240.1 chemotaxis protein [Paenibacillus psychroresistens]
MKIAIAIVHGMGQQKLDFYLAMESLLIKKMALVNPSIQLHIEGVFWGDITDKLEKKLWARTQAIHQHHGKPTRLRSFVLNYLGDVIAYQAVPKENDPCPNDYIYDDIHKRYAECLLRLSKKAGENAPLCVISHSLGTIISSNFFYDLQNNKMIQKAADVINSSNSNLVKGQTLTHFYTLGSPIALWTMRFEHFGIPIRVPAPNLKKLAIGEWVNFYDKNDLLAFPIKGLNPQYYKNVSKDVEVRCPGILSWTPLSHEKYLKSHEVADQIVKSLSELGKKKEGK